jgi:toxin FitB
VIVLDTNVISELMRPEPNLRVFAWLAKQPRQLLYTTYINQAEILSGIAMLPEGQRRTALAAAADTFFSRELAGRLLPFGAAAAEIYPTIVVKRRRVGKPIIGLDALIGAIAPAAGAAVATRDTGGFTGCGVRLIDPWSVD